MLECDLNIKKKYVQRGLNINWRVLAMWKQRVYEALRRPNVVGYLVSKSETSQRFLINFILK